MLNKSKKAKAEVSILARLWGRALRQRVGRKGVAVIVSILARLWGRALLGNADSVIIVPGFQSSPGFGAGRYVV